MAKWVEVDPDDVPNLREGRRGRVSYPLLKTFLETGLTVAKLDRTGIQQALQPLSMTLGTYVRSHNLPIHLFTRGGEIFAARTDIDEDGNPNPLYNDIDKVPSSGDVTGQAPIGLTDAPLIDDNVVDERYGLEKNLTTK
jgi:hypothetical protein